MEEQPAEDLKQPQARMDDLALLKTLPMPVVIGIGVVAALGAAGLEFAKRAFLKAEGFSVAKDDAFIYIAPGVILFLAFAAMKLWQKRRSQ